MSEERDLIADSHDIESMLEVGMPCMCHTDMRRPHGSFHKAILRGWHSGSYLIMELLTTDDIGIYLPNGQNCLLKFRREGDTWSFEASVQDNWVERYSYHFRLSWPNTVKRIVTRKHDRIEAVMPCNVVLEDGAWLKGQIRDIGAGGCRLCLKTPPGNGSAIHISFTMPDGTTLEDVKSIVRTTTPFGKGAFIGCQFDEAEAGVKQNVELYVATQLEQQRTRKRNCKRVLVIERDPKLAASLQQALERRSFDVVCTNGVVEGFSLLRTMLPSVLMVNYDHGQLPGPEVCRVVHATPGFRNLPIFLYGRDSDEQKNQALEAGAAGYIPYAYSAGKIVHGAFADEGQDEAIASAHNDFPETDTPADGQ